jgi:tRNA(fMet)-specific endonuclease VapC
VLRRAAEYQREHGSLRFTSVSVGEILYGLHAKNARSQVAIAERFFGAHDELVPTSQDYRIAAEINAALYKAGKPIGDADALIAACAHCRNMSLATGNVRHYQYVIDVGFDLRIENWRDHKQV